MTSKDAHAKLAITEKHGDLEELARLLLAALP